MTTTALNELISEFDAEVARRLKEIKRCCLWQIERLKGAIEQCDRAMAGNPDAFDHLGRIEALGASIEREQNELKVLVGNARMLRTLRNAK